jgi:hypothetical protein
VERTRLAAFLVRSAYNLLRITKLCHSCIELRERRHFSRAAPKHPTTPADAKVYGRKRTYKRASPIRPSLTMKRRSRASKR